MKSILISVQPKWCELIANGQKTIEVRKTRPQCDVPFKVYIYCTCGERHEAFVRHNKNYDIIPLCLSELEGKEILNGKVIGEFVCNSIIKIGYNDDGYGLDALAINGIIAKSCVPEKELYHYLQGKRPYCWHISDLVIYDKPKELGEFTRYSKKDIRPCQGGKFCSHDYYDVSENVNACDIDFDGSNCPNIKISRPPQSWCYVEESI